MRRNICLFAWMAHMTLVAAAQEPEGKVGELEGKWVGVQLEASGTALPEVGKKWKLEISRGKVSLFDGEGGSGGGTIQIDSTKRPKHINWKASLRAGGDTGRSEIIGIYELNGDTLRICYNTIDKANKRPTEFKTRGEGAGRYMLTFQRAK